MSKAEELIKAFQAANEKYSAAVDAEQNDRELERLYNDAHDALIDYVPERPMSLNEERMTQEFFYQELGQMREAEQVYQTHIHLLKHSLEEMTVLIEKIYCEITNKNMDLLVLTNEHADQIKKAKEILNKGYQE